MYTALVTSLDTRDSSKCGKVVAAGGVSRRAGAQGRAVLDQIRWSTTRKGYFAVRGGRGVLPSTGTEENACAGGHTGHLGSTPPVTPGLRTLGDQTTSWWYDAACFSYAPQPHTSAQTWPSCFCSPTRTLQPRKDKPVPIPLPHPLYSTEGQEICLFVKDTADGQGGKEAKKRLAKMEKNGGVAKVGWEGRGGCVCGEPARRACSSGYRGNCQQHRMFDLSFWGTLGNPEGHPRVTRSRPGLANNVLSSLP